MVIIRPVELSDEFTDRDYCNELIHLVPLCGEVVLSRNYAFILGEEIAQLYGYFKILRHSLKRIVTFPERIILCYPRGIRKRIITQVDVKTSCFTQCIILKDIN